MRIPSPSRARAPGVERRVLSAVLLLLAVAGCAHNWPNPPRGAVSSRDDAFRHVDGYGEWGRFEYRHEGQAHHSEGELLAASPDSILVLEPGGLMVIPTAELKRATFAMFYWSGGSTEYKTVKARDEWQRVQPRGAREGSESRANDVPLAELRVHARFPQGVPPGIDPGALRPRSADRAPPGRD